METIALIGGMLFGFSLARFRSRRRIIYRRTLRLERPDLKGFVKFVAGISSPIAAIGGKQIYPSGAPGRRRQVTKSVLKSSSIDPDLV
jgi:hypothetical protein